MQSKKKRAVNLNNMKLNKITGIDPPIKRKFKSNILLANDVSVGIEIELEGVRSRPPLEYWRWSSDDSLRNRGYELILIEPLFGEDLMDAINELDSVRENNPTVVYSKRASTHTHIDFREASVGDIQSLLPNYIAIEPAIFSGLCESHRESNNFCVPYYNYQPVIDTLLSSFSRGSSSELSSIFGDRHSKYNAMYLGSLMKFGSVEFRHLHSTLNKTDILNWVNTLIRLKENVINRETVPLDVHSLIKFIITKYPELSQRMSYPQLRSAANKAIPMLSYIKLGGYNKMIKEFSPSKADTETVIDIVNKKLGIKKDSGKDIKQKVAINPAPNPNSFTFNTTTDTGTISTTTQTTLSNADQQALTSQYRLWLSRQQARRNGGGS